VRGESQGAAKTATEQRIKGQYASLRLRSMQQEVAVYATELLRLKAQIIANFDPQTLATISAADQLAEADRQYIQPALEMIRDKPLRNFRIEVAADSLVQIDEETEKQDRVEFLTAVGAFVKGAAEVGAAAPALAPLLMELLQFGVRGFKVGKSVEGTMDQALEQLKQAAAQPQAQKPDPEMAKVEAQKQIEAAKLQAQQQADQAKLQAESQHTQMKIAADKEIAFNKMATDKEVRMHEIQTTAVGEQMRHGREMDFENKKHDGEMQMQDKKMQSEGMHKNADREVNADQQEKDRQLQAKQGEESSGAKSAESMTKAMGEFAKSMKDFAQAQKEMAAAVAADTEIVRGADGKAKGSKKIIKAVK
jgi:hypothetical protein